MTALRVRDHAGPAIIPELTAAMPQQLGRFPLWQGNREFVPAMQDIFRAGLAAGSRSPHGAGGTARQRNNRVIRGTGTGRNSGLKVAVPA